MNIAIILSSCASADDELTRDIGRLQQSLIDDDTEPAAEVAETPTQPVNGRRHLAIRGGRVLRSNPVLRIIDVRDPQLPKVESELHEYRTDSKFFAIGAHVIIAGVARGYTGERDDIPRPQPGGLLNIDLSDPGKLTVINSVPLQHRHAPGFMVHGQGQAGDAIYRISNRDSSEDRVWLSRYELQNEQLVFTGEIELPYEVEKAETAGTQVLLHFRKDGKPAPIGVIDGSGPDLQIAYWTSVPGFDVQAMTIDGPKLRVAYSGRSQGEYTVPTVDTFDLTKSDSRRIVGRCDVGPFPEPTRFTYLDTLLYSKTDHAFFASVQGRGRTYQIPFNVWGTCPKQRILTNDTSRAFQIPASRRLFALTEQELQLFDTAHDASAPLLASAPLTGYISLLEAATPQPIQVFEMERAATADDGTPEPWLVGVPYWDHVRGIDYGTFELFSASDRTLTRQSTLSELSPAGDLALFNSTLVTLSSAEVRTFDIHDLRFDQLGALELDVHADPDLRFGDYTARMRSAQLRGQPVGISPIDTMIIEPLDAVGRTQVASWRALDFSTWLKAEDLLLEARWIFTSSSLSPYLTIQAYDLSDPGQPRKAGVFFSDEIRREDVDLSEFGLTFRSVGRMLAIAQRPQVEGSSTGSYSLVRFVDFTDPDKPAFTYEPFIPEEADFSSLPSGVKADSTLYLSQQRQDGYMATRIEVPFWGGVDVTAFPIPAPIVAASQNHVYTARPDDTASDLTLSRVNRSDESWVVSATRTWQGRQLTSIHTDDGPNLYLTHAPRPGAAQPNQPNSHWTQLEILNADTLETVSSLNIDTEATIQDSNGGRLFIEIPGAILIVDVRDRGNPTAQAAVPSAAPLILHDDHFHVGSQRYPSDLQNLTH